MSLAPLKNPMPAFTCVTLSAPALIALGAVFGGGWAVVAFIWMSVVTLLLDELVTWVMPTVEGDEFPAADRLSVTLALVHFGLWVLIICAVSGGTGLQTWEQTVVLAATILFMGQVSNANAHELIHRSSRGLRRFGRWVYISMLFGHHCSAHTLVHHVHVGTPDDPNTARLHEGFYRFFSRAWLGGFQRGWAAETDRRTRTGRRAIAHPYVTYLGGGALVLVLAGLIGGWWGIGTALIIGFFAQMQMMMTDYVQHYGLVRRKLPNGKYEHVQTRHSWNAPHFVSSALMLNAPRHSDHHAHPQRPYPALRLEDDSPMLPYSLPVMAVIALFPAIWREIMTPLAEDWRGEEAGT